jgi:hypothetical protein
MPMIDGYTADGTFADPHTLTIEQFTRIVAAARAEAATLGG